MTQFTTTGTAAVSLHGAGEFKAAGYVGAPYANLHAGGFGKLSMKGETSIGLSGSSLSSNHTGGAAVGHDLNGFVDINSDIKASGGLFVGYEALFTGGELGRWELTSSTLGKLGLRVDKGGAQATAAFYPEWPDMPKLVETVPLADVEREGGASGAGAGSGNPDAGAGGAPAASHNSSNGS